MRHHSTSSRHRIRAVIGTGIGLAALTVAAVGAYFDDKPGKGTKWAWLVLPAVPLVGWGCGHLARYRGYPSTAAYGLFVLASIVSSLIGINRSPLTFGVAFVFLGLMPS